MIEHMFYNEGMDKHCSALTAAGRPCKGHPVPGTNPPLCAAHGGAEGRPGAPMGNQNARKHGFYATLPDPRPEPEQIPNSIDDVIDDLADKQAKLSQLIDAVSEDLDIPTLTRLLALHAQGSTRLGRLLLDRRAVSDDPADSISDAIDQALDQLSTDPRTTL